MPGSDGPENLKILKRGQLKVDFGPCSQRVGLSAIEHSCLSDDRNILIGNVSNEGRYAIVEGGVIHFLTGIAEVAVHI